MASSSLIKEGTKNCIVVVVESKDFQQLPKAYNKIFDHSKRGKFIPFAGLIDNDLKKVAMYLKYEEVKEHSKKKTFSMMNTKIAEIAKSDRVAMKGIAEEAKKAAAAKKIAEKEQLAIRAKNAKEMILSYEYKGFKHKRKKVKYLGKSGNKYEFLSATGRAILLKKHEIHKKYHAQLD